MLSTLSPSLPLSLFPSPRGGRGGISAGRDCIVWCLLKKKKNKNQKTRECCKALTHQRNSRFISTRSNAELFALYRTGTRIESSSGSTVTKKDLCKHCSAKVTPAPKNGELGAALVPRRGARPGRRGRSGWTTASVGGTQERVRYSYISLFSPIIKNIFNITQPKVS